MSNIDIKGQLDPLLKKLETDKSLDVAEKLAATLVGFLGVSAGDRYLLNIPRVDAELSRFELAPGFARQAAAYELPNDNADVFDLKLFWIKKATKTNLSWIVGLTPNYEDSEANDYKNIGIDFVVPETSDSLIILLSSKYKIRSLELKGSITQTQHEIFSNWLKIQSIEKSNDAEIKNTIHSSLWESFNFEPINREFYLDLVEAFSLLVHHLEPLFGKKPSVMFTTRLIGRLLFIWFLKKKNLINTQMDYFSVSELDQTKYYRNSLEVLFFEVLNKEINDRGNSDGFTPYLNGGLFDVSLTDFYRNEQLTFPNSFFNNLYNTFNKYNFTVDESSPEFQHVAIDPEMLGRIFESLLSEQMDEDTGDNKKKITGAFYTPREIVSYMCEESVLEFLKSRIPETIDRDRRLEELIRLPETIFRDQDQNKRRDWKPYSELIIRALDGENGQEPITILDPAVGSGAFPMGMLHLLVKIYTRLDVKYEKNISTLKLNILSKSLYGVDIEQTAVEICRLRAWLSIIVDIPDTNVEPLPNLDFKFVCANTLIPLNDDKQLSLDNDLNLKAKLIELRNNYFSTSNKSAKLRLQKEYIELTSHSDLFDDKKTTQLKRYNPFDLSQSSDFYDPELFHGLETFDLIIGNPPYIQLQKDKGKLSKLYQHCGYKSYASTGDIYCLFYELAYLLLKPDGFLTFITSNKWLRSKYGENLREFLSKNTSPTLLLDLGSGIFETATVDTNILIYKKTNIKNNFVCSMIRKNLNKENLSLDAYVKNHKMVINQFGREPWVIMSPIEEKIVSKAKKEGKKLENWNVYINKGLMTGYNNAFYINRDQKDQLLKQSETANQIIKSLFRGREIKKYFTPQNDDSFVLVVSDKIDIDNYPSIKNHLSQFRNKLEERAQFIRGDHPWFSVDNCPSEKMIDLFKNTKIIYPNMSQTPFMTIDEKGSVSNDKTFILASDDDNLIYYVAGILNSKIGQFLIRKFCPTLGENGFELRKVFVTQIPLPIVDNEQLSKFVDLVKQIYKLNVNQNGSNQFSQEIENKIDRLSYDFYKLNNEEIEYIEYKFLH